MSRRAPPIAASSLADVIERVLLDHESYCLGDVVERDELVLALVAAHEARPEAVALREAWADSPTEATLIIAMREAGGDLEGTLLGAAARLAGLEVTR